ncbi:MAG: GGDEF domain-containing protein [Holophagales bacterium]|nr:GGDEF domain-containing protein [Holophagales bacterium]
MSPDTGIRDAVTGLYVREYFDDVIARDLERSRRHEIPLSVVSVVIRDFDRLAAAGEEATVSVLVEIARELGRNVRETDHLFRWEDDEFLLLLFGADAAACAQKVQQLDQLFRTWRQGGGPIPAAVRIRVGGATHESDIVFASVLQASRAMARPGVASTPAARS